jgi:cytidine deaminase
MTEYRPGKEEIGRLIEAAMKMREQSYSPYSGFSVGAALLCSDGTVYTGCNIENASYPVTICAERTAMAKAVSEGHRKYSRIAIYGESRGYCMPCGSCRQFLAEFSPEMEVLCSRADGRYVSYKLSELLPHTFDY